MATEPKLPELYCEGLGLSLNSTHPDHQIDIAEGCCRCCDDCDDMDSNATITVDIEAAGANGLDAGAEAVDTTYYVWLIHDIDTPTVAGLLSTSSTDPTMPGGYTYKRLLGFVHNDASEDFEEPDFTDLDMHDKDVIDVKNITAYDGDLGVQIKDEVDGTVCVRNVGGAKGTAGYDDAVLDNHNGNLVGYWNLN